jgi:hypothetical protein
VWSSIWVMETLTVAAESSIQFGRWGNRFRHFLDCSVESEATVERQSRELKTKSLKMEDHMPEVYRLLLSVNAKCLLSFHEHAYRWLY